MKFIVFIGLFFGFSCVFASPAAEAELKKIDEIQSQLNLKKDWAKFRYDEASTACYNKFFTDSCLKDARKIYRQETLDIRTQELPMHDRQRELKRNSEN